MNDTEYLWPLLLTMILTNKKERDMVDVKAVVKNDKNEEIVVTKDKDGSILIATKSNYISVDGRDLIQAVIAVGGLIDNFPFNTSVSNHPYDSGAKGVTLEPWNDTYK